MGLLLSELIIEADNPLVAFRQILGEVANLLFKLVGALQVGIGVYGLLTIAILGRVFYGLDAWWEGFSSAYWGTPLVPTSFAGATSAPDDDRATRLTRAASISCPTPAGVTSTPTW